MSAEFWDQKSGKYDEEVRKHGSLYDKTLETTSSLLSDSATVLDFGCASGEFSLDIAAHAKRVHGIDTSAKMIELAIQKTRDRQIHNVSFMQCDAFDRALLPGSFSAVVAFDVFHLLDDMPGALKRLHDLLVAGGLLISLTPCLGERGWFFRTLIGLAQKSGLAPPILELTITGLETLFIDSHFDILETETRERKYARQCIVARKVRKLQNARNLQR